MKFIVPTAGFSEAEMENCHDQTGTKIDIFGANKGIRPTVLRRNDMNICFYVPVFNKINFYWAIQFLIWDP